MAQLISDTGFDYKEAMSYGHTYNEKVAHVLNGLGIDCYAPELSFAETREDVEQYTLHEKDVIFTRINGCIEVKSMNRDFTTDPATFPLSNIIVDTVSGYDKKLEKPLAYIIVSQITKDMIVVPVSTERFWFQDQKMDFQRGIYENFYFCPKGLAKPFSELVDYLRHLQESSAA